MERGHGKIDAKKRVRKVYHIIYSFSHTGNEDLVLAELDSVLDSHQSKDGSYREQQPQDQASAVAANAAGRINPNSSGSSSGKSSGSFTLPHGLLTALYINQ